MFNGNPDEDPETDTSGTEFKTAEELASMGPLGWVKGKLSSLWNSKAIGGLRAAFTVAKYATAPVWWPTKKILEGASHLWEKADGHKLGKIAIAFGTAAMLATQIGATAYVADYGVAYTGDHLWFGQPYSHGQRQGVVSKLSQRGKFPCDTWEGELAMPNFTKDGSSAGSGTDNTFVFSVRRMNGKVIEQLKKAYEEGYSVSLEYNQSHWPTHWFSLKADQGQNTAMTSAMSCIQKTDYNIVKVTPKPNAHFPAPAKMPQIMAPGAN